MTPSLEDFEVVHSEDIIDFVFSETLRRHKKRLGLTFEGIASITMLQKARVEELFTNKGASVRLNELEALAECFNISPDVLIKIATGESIPKHTYVKARMYLEAMRKN